MATIQENALPSKSSIVAADKLRAIGSDSKSYQALVSDVAKYIVENYNGSTIAGSAQTIQSAVNALNSKLGDYLRQVSIAGNGSGTFTFPSGKFGFFVWSVGTAPAGLHFLYTNSSGVQAIKVYATSTSYNPTFSYANNEITITNTGGSYLRGSLVFT